MAKIALLGDIKVCGHSVVIDQELIKLCHQADCVVANLEGPIVTHAKPRLDKQSPLHSDQKITRIFRDLNISILILGNNHIMDYGLDGLRESIVFIEAQGISWVGATDGDKRENWIIKLPHLKLAVLSFAHEEGPMAMQGESGAGPYGLPDINMLKAKINILTNDGYSVIVSYHGGEEFYQNPWPRRLGWAQTLVSAGALAVFGHHSHSVQPVYTSPKGEVVALGLGSAFFETSGLKLRKGTQYGIIVLIDTETNITQVGYLYTDWSRCTLSLLEPCKQFVNMLEIDKAVSGWVSECRRHVFGYRLNVIDRKGSWWRGPAVSCLFILRLIRTQFRSLRDKDILLSSLPIFGPRWAHKAFRAGKESFRF